MKTGEALLLTLALVSQALSAPAGGDTKGELTLRTQSALFEIDGRGFLEKIERRENGRNYLAVGQPAPLLSVRVAGMLHAPESARWDARAKQLTLHYVPAGVTVVLAARAKATHITFEVMKVEPAERVELIIWGPYPTVIGQTIGDTVGVVRDAEFAVGIQALNPKTLGGYPTHENDIEAEWDADDHGLYADLDPELLKAQHYRSDTARATAFGSTLQAYCRNRDHDRIISNWGHESYLTLPYRDGGVVGSRIALFACPADRALDTIGRIEIVEGLPHPMLDGVWAKRSPTATASYLIVDFSESNIDQAIRMARQAGLKYLYHSSPFATWGHFQLKPELFPHGWDGLRACIEKGRRAGIRIGFHTLSNFITPNDPYVTPRPDPRLARIGNSALAADLDAAQTEIPVAAPDVFAERSTLDTVVIGEELIRYSSVSKAAPWRLLGCARGAWGTQAAAHARGATVGRLLDHPYNVFLTDASLAQEVARNIAALCNRTGAQQLSFDGLEGNWSTGYGQYGRTLFTAAWYEALSPELRGHIINDASNPGHYNWHIATRMNWGEPWYAGFRESQTLYRFKNQVYFERNLMPRMLGWFALRPDTSIEDAEWLLARAAGYDAGFALATSLASTAQLAADPNSAETARVYGAVPAILNAIRQWETARRAGAFPPAVRSALRDNAREFHLQPAGKGAWDLVELHSARFSHDATLSAPAEFRFTNVDAGQSLGLRIRAVGAEPIRALALTVNGAIALDLRDRSLPAGGSLTYSGGPEAVIADADGKEVAHVPVDVKAMHVGPGPQWVTLRCAQQSGSSVEAEMRTYSAPLRIGASAS
ncbi:MAG TPA: hypothetical protein VKT32_11050 [Chthonomonadaceae bacterium]|nr:hypothetical protein [Chthonomonadaceae bacterium]